jgi:predicted dehydrogenase
MSNHFSRREFLGASAALGAAALLNAPARAFGPNDTIRVGLLGCGGRCRHLLNSLLKIPGVKVTAICDIWDEALKQIKPSVDEQAFVTKDYRAVLDRKDVDAVLIASPDHWHVPMTVAACDAGKDVYVEKPLTHDLSEGERVLEAGEKSKRIVQVGTQQRSMPHIAQAREMIQAGKIGQVLKVRMSWNRNSDRVRRNKLGVDPNAVDWKKFLGSAPDQPFDEYRFRNWRWFWDFGGGIFTDLMVHWIDVAHWCLNLEHPLSAVSVGDHVVSEDVWETPDTVQTLLQYPGNVQMHFEGTFSNANRGAMIEFLGTEATIYLDRGGMVLTPERRSKLPPEELILGTGPRGADFYDKPDGELLHLTNWIDCVRKREQPTAPIAAGVNGAAAAHLANIALRSRQTAHWPST